MPRKPKVEKQTITVVVNGKPVAVILHPPTAARKSWYAYWPGLVTTNAIGISPHSGSGAPTTAASATLGGAAIAFSISIDEMFSPPLMMISFLRSTIWM